MVEASGLPYNTGMVTRRLGWIACGALVATLLGAGAAGAQPPPVPPPVPQPFPKPNAPAKTAPAAPQQPAVAGVPSPGAAGEPTEATLGVPVYPGAVYLGTFDAGRGQSYYLFGTKNSYTDIVNYYKIVLKDRGEEVFDAPGTYMFEVGKFREDSMVFPPGVTVKDYTWNGSEGYLAVNGTTGTRYPTIIQIVPPPAGSGR